MTLPFGMRNAPYRTQVRYTPSADASSFRSRTA